MPRVMRSAVIFLAGFDLTLSTIAMDNNSCPATEFLSAVKSELKTTSSVLTPSDDQCFLLYLIFGTFFGPDLKGEKPQKSVLQRFAEALPTYASDQLAGSHIKMVEIERVYYYVLRKADQSVAVKLPWLRQFFQGNLTMPAQNFTAAYPQFPDLFPPQLHPHSRFKNRHKIIENIVFINNPETFYIKPEDIRRFKRLTGLEGFLLDGNRARLHTRVNDEVLSSREEGESNGELLPQRSSQDTHSYMAQLPAEADASTEERFKPGMVFLRSSPTPEEWENLGTATRSGFAITGSAAMGHIGRVIGLLDIGECEDSYLFRVSLPGVKRDEREFSCEVDSDGRVLIRGVTTTGERRVHMHSQVFEMQTQNLCPPGHFSITFKLPGPVDPRQFSGNFGTDGILEGIVMKEGE
ncbi:hypothetical protein U1Q18_004204 [Sarracenia purpurea var. burkii]